MHRKKKIKKINRPENKKNLINNNFVVFLLQYSYIWILKLNYDSTFAGKVGREESHRGCN